MSTTLYSNLISESQENNERNDCTVIALSVVTGESYATCWKAMRVIAGRRPRKGCHMISRLDKILAPFGLSYDLVWQKRARRGGFSMMTAAQRLSWRERYLIFTARHVAAMVNGTIHDWSANRRLRVLAVYRIRTCSS